MVSVAVGLSHTGAADLDEHSGSVASGLERADCSVARAVA
jgi:hypothetical protein